MAATWRERSTTAFEPRTAQLQDDIIGPMLQAKETKSKPTANTIKGDCREVAQLIQQLELQHGV